MCDGDQEKALGDVAENVAQEAVRAIDEHSLVWIRGGEEVRLLVLKEFIATEELRELGIAARDGRSFRGGFQSLRDETMRKEGPSLAVIDYWEQVWIHPGDVADFQQWLGEFTADRRGAVVFGSAVEPSERTGLLPEWVLEELYVVDVDDVESVPEREQGLASRAQEPRDMTSLFPPLEASGETRAAPPPQAPTGPSGPSGQEPWEHSEPSEEHQRADSPVRRFYDVLIELHGERDLRLNLDYDDDFNSMVGPMEARFCEWIHHQVEHRRLAVRLRDYHILSPADVHRLARDLGMEWSELRGLDRKHQIRKVLEALGIREPELPPVIEDGVTEIRALGDAFASQRSEGVTNIEGRELSPEARVPAARRGAERLLKLIAKFLWDAGLQEVFVDVVDGELREFRNAGLEPKRSSADWLNKADLGTLNHLLQAVDKERIARGRRLKFMRDRDAFWGDAVFWPFNQLAASLSQEVHEGTAKNKRRSRQQNAVEDVLRIIDGGPLRIPQPVQFFRRYLDDLGEHYEGWGFEQSSQSNRREPKLIRFYELNQSRQLHVPYLYLSATNPSAVDAVCSPVDEALLTPP